MHRSLGNLTDLYIMFSPPQTILLLDLLFKKKIHELYTNSILTIHNLTSRHNGNYTCEISNRGGTVDYTALLSVAGS